jgi:hypothetical protein
MEDNLTILLLSFEVVTSSHPWTTHHFPLWVCNLQDRLIFLENEGSTACNNSRKITL